MVKKSSGANLVTGSKSLWSQPGIPPVTVFMLNFLPYKPTGPVSSNIYRPTINSTGPNLKITLMTINSKLKT
jgi:hypothetical protein